MTANADGPRPLPDPEQIGRALARIQESLPWLTVDGPALFQHLATHLPSDERWETWLAQVELADLALAFACGSGDARALEVFDRDYRSELEAAFAKMRFSVDRRDDVKQALFQKLFVGTGGRPRILEYSGRGQLRHWFRVTVVRALLDDLRRSKVGGERALDDHVLGVPSPHDDPEIEHLKRLYAHEFALAFEAAVRGLAAEDRNVLRAYYAAEMTIDEIAVAFGMHRATAARRVNRAREHLVLATRQELGNKLRLRETELESVMRLIESRLHLSVRRLLE